MKTVTIAVARGFLGLAFLFALSTLVRAVPVNNLVQNGGFEEAWGNWKSSFETGLFLGHPHAPEGNRWAGVSVNLYQDIPTVPGQHYHLRFALAGETKNDHQVVGNVSWDGKFLGSTTLTSISDKPKEGDWVYCDYDIVATGSLTRLLFENGFVAKDQAILLDAVELVPVNAPARVPDSSSVALFPAYCCSCLC